ncbi:MAG: efflux RND transporter periplasmic adaptor subunit [Sedimentisphaerales bacterium]
METTEQNTEQKPKKFNTERIIIIVMAIIIIALAVYLAVYHKMKTNRDSANQPKIEEPKIAVVAAPVTTRTFERTVNIQGNLESKNFALVSPRIAGTIEKFFVDEGNNVIANESKLFATDSVALQQVVEIRKKLLDIANSTEKQAQANLEKTQADFNKAEIDYNRFKRLYEKKAVTADAFEQQESLYKQLIAAITSAKADIDLTKANIEKAKADLAIAEKDLADTIVYAPITGKISQRFKEPGEMGRPGEPAVRIDDNIIIDTSAFLPAQYYPEITEGQTKMKISVSGRDLGEHDIYYKSPTINSKLRTFEVKCLLDNPAQTIAAGEMAEISVVLETRKGLAVPTESILRREEQFVIFVVRDGKAHQVQVKKGIENNGWTEVVSSELNEQSVVVTMGQNMLDEGKAVSVQKGNE